MTLREALQQAATTIARQDARQDARRDAEVLAQHVLARDRAWLLAHPDTELDAAQLSALRDLATRRAAHTPLQHLTGQQEFFGRDFRVSPDVLIPRPETELLVEAVLHWLRARNIPHPRILDVGTGSGAIAITLALELPAAQVTALDLSPAALAMARHNAESLSATLRFLESNLLAAVSTESFDVIVSNPPYVPRADAPTLAPEVLDHEPHLALFADDEGLAIYRRLIPQAHAALTPGGLLAMEFGFGQRDALRGLFHAQPSDAHPNESQIKAPSPNENNPAPWTEPDFRNDYANIPRLVLAERR